MDIGCGIPDLIVCPVKDADEILCAMLQQPLQSAAVFGSENLSRICGADGCEAVTIMDASFEEGDLAIELQPLREDVVT